MAEHEHTDDLLSLFKALADKNRLKIIGLLARKPHAVEELSVLLNLGASTVSHHLSVLGRAGLVAGKPKGYYNIYALQTAQLEQTAKQLLHREQLKGLAEETTGDAYEKKVLAAFTTGDGKIKSFPTQEKKYLVLLRYVLREFHPGTQYTERQVNEILSRFSDDTARLRRSLVEYRFMQREGGGGRYWRIEDDTGTPTRRQNVAV